MKKLFFLLIGILTVYWGTTVWAATEDFTTYTEVDPNGHITVVATSCEAVGLTWSEEAYVYKDFTEGYFDELDVDFELFVDGTSTQYGGMGMGFSNAVDDITGWGTDGISVRINNRGSNVAWVILGLEYDVATDYYAGDVDTIYYCTLTREAGNNTSTLYVYSDSARTNLLDTLVMGGYGTTTWRYAYGLVNNNSALVRTGYYYIGNLNLNIAETGTTSSTSTGIFVDWFSEVDIYFVYIFIFILLLLVSKSIIIIGSNLTKNKI